MKWRCLSRTIRRELAYYRALANDPRTPRLSKALIGIALAYLLSPIDLIPDFIPILGQLDDLVVVPALIWFAVALIPTTVKVEARAAVSDESS